MTAIPNIAPRPRPAGNGQRPVRADRLFGGGRCFEHAQALALLLVVGALAGTGSTQLDRCALILRVEAIELLLQLADLALDDRRLARGSRRRVRGTKRTAQLRDLAIVECDLVVEGAGATDWQVVLAVLGELLGFLEPPLGQNDVGMRFGIGRAQGSDPIPQPARPDRGRRSSWRDRAAP